MGVIWYTCSESGISIYTFFDLQVYLLLLCAVRHFYIFELWVRSFPISIISYLRFSINWVRVRVGEGMPSRCFVSICIQPVTDTQERHFLVIPHICYDWRKSLLVVGVRRPPQISGFKVETKGKECFGFKYPLTEIFHHCWIKKNFLVGRKPY